MNVPPRGLRALIFALVATSLATAFHALAGGPVPGAAVLGLAVLVIAGAAWCLAGAQRSSWQIGGALLAGQLALHYALAAGCTTTHESMAAMGHAGHAGHTGHLAHDMGTSTASAGSLPSASMLLAHVFAAALAGWWLARGERRFWAATRRAHAWVGRELRSLPPRLAWAADVPLFPHAFETGVALLRRPLVDGLSRRGPPIGTLAA